MQQTALSTPAGLGGSASIGGGPGSSAAKESSSSLSESASDKESARRDKSGSAMSEGQWLVGCKEPQSVIPGVNTQNSVNISESSSAGGNNRDSGTGTNSPEELSARRSEKSEPESAGRKKKNARVDSKPRGDEGDGHQNLANSRPLNETPVHASFPFMLNSSKANAFY